MKSILHKDFRYVPSHKTCIRDTFARVRRELAAQAKAREDAEKSMKVRRIGAK